MSDNPPSGPLALAPVIPNEDEGPANSEPRCPRCLSRADHSPDDKECSDQCITRLRAELTQWETWGIVEVAVRNRSVSEYMNHWEGRALKAEADLAALRVLGGAPKEDPALLSALTFIEASLPRWQHTEAVADCYHCNVGYIVEWVRKQLAAHGRVLGGAPTGDEEHEHDELARAYVNAGLVLGQAAVPPVVPPEQETVAQEQKNPAAPVRPSLAGLIARATEYVESPDDGSSDDQLNLIRDLTAALLRAGAAAKPVDEKEDH